MTVARAIGFAFVVSAAAIGAKAEPYFIVGEMVDGNVHSLAVEDRATNKSTWVPIGDKVGEFVLSSYDSSAKTAVLNEGAKSVKIAWRDAPQHDSNQELDARMKEMILKKIRKDFEANEVAFIGDVITHDKLVSFRVVKVLKSKEGRPVAGDIVDGGAWLFEGTSGINRSIVFLEKFPHENNSGVEWMGMWKTGFLPEVTESDAEQVIFGK